MQKNHKTTIAIIGGGRWGQVTLSVLSAMKLPYHHVVVSQTNYDKIKIQLDNLPPSCGSFSVVSSISDLLTEHEVKAALVVNSANQHFKTASQLINNGIHVLIEKPVVLSTHEANLLIENAISNKIILTPGLCYRFCSYINNFASKVDNGAVPYDFIFEWFDANNEIRYQQIKRHDTSINVVQEVMPHIWTILSMVFREMTINIEQCDPASSRDFARLFVSVGNIRGQIILNRNAPERRRYFSVKLTNGDHLAIDFTSEPGTIIHGKNTYPGEANWSKMDSPLTQQLKYFLSKINGCTLDKQDLESCLQSVKCTETASTLLQQQYRQIV